MLSLLRDRLKGLLLSGMFLVDLLVGRCYGELHVGCKDFCPKVSCRTKALLHNEHQSCEEMPSFCMSDRKRLKC